MATTIGDGVFGLADDETGIITHTIKYSFSQDTTELEDKDNEVIGVAFTKEKVDITIDGKLPDSAAFDGKLGAALVLINTMPSYLQGSVSAGTTYIDKIDVDMDKGEYHDISLTAVYRPSLISA